LKNYFKLEILNEIKLLPTSGFMKERSQRLNESFASGCRKSQTVFAFVSLI